MTSWIFSSLPPSWHGCIFAFLCTVSFKSRLRVVVSKKFCRIMECIPIYWWSESSSEWISNNPFLDSWDHLQAEKEDEQIPRPSSSLVLKDERQIWWRCVMSHIQFHMNIKRFHLIHLSIFILVPQCTMTSEPDELFASLVFLFSPSFDRFQSTFSYIDYFPVNIYFSSHWIINCCHLCVCFFSVSPSRLLPLTGVKKTHHLKYFFFLHLICIHWMYSSDIVRFEFFYADGDFHLHCTDSHWALEQPQVYWISHVGNIFLFIFIFTHSHVCEIKLIIFHTGKSPVSWMKMMLSHFYAGEINSSGQSVI